jgi:tyrosyl-tRNA synthetase
MDKNDLINEVLTRGVENIYPSKEFLREKLLNGEKLVIYLGIDPTGPTLHLGHSIALLKLSQFQQLGHSIILLIGDFTATIGDPTDKMSARIPLTREQFLENAKLYKAQASKILNFEGSNPAQLKYNSEWLDKLSMADTANLLSHVTYAQTIKRDMFQKRISEGKDLYINEFLYPVLQGYDSVAMEVDGEVGGNDQTFNMLMGRDLLKRMKNKEKFVVANKLLVDVSGKKMGKTEGNMVTLNETPDDMFGKIMGWSDGLIIPALELCTRISFDEIDKVKKDLISGNPKDSKIRLAFEVVKIYHGEESAKKALENFDKTFSKKETPDDLPEVPAKRGEELMDIVLSNKILSSKAEFKRLIDEGGVRILPEGEKVEDFHFKLEKNVVVKIGKHKFLNIKVS